MASIYNRLFAKLYDKFMHGFEKGLVSNRNELVSGLKGKVLEVGSGTGVNFSFYNKDAEVTALEPSAPMIKVSKTKNCNCSKIDYVNNGITDDILFNYVDEKSFDNIISTLVLCTVDNPKKAIANYKRLLKPNGKLIVLEHIHSTSKKDRILQNIANPFWNVFSEGCNLNRNTDQLIIEGGFKSVKHEYFVKTLRWVKGVYELDSKTGSSL